MFLYVCEFSTFVDTFINLEPLTPVGSRLNNILIATVFNADAALVAAHRLSPDRMFLLISEEPTKEQEAAIKLLKDSLGRVIEIKTEKISLYDIVQIAHKVIELIDHQPNEDEIYLNITSGRKTQAIGVLMAAYARNSRVKKIAYNPEEDKGAVVYLPRLSFNLNDSQRKILDHLAKAEGKSIVQLADEIDISRAMLYKTIRELEDLDFIEKTTAGIKLTAAGKIARM